MDTYYNLLGIKPNASKEEIKTAYKIKLKSSHPDKGGSEEEYRQIQEAYNVLYKNSVSEEVKPEVNNNVAEQIFSNLFGQSKNKVEDIDVDIIDIYYGNTIKHTLTRKITCKNCTARPCRTCNGKGTMMRMVPIGQMYQYCNAPCIVCNGTKLMNRNAITCNMCDDTGMVNENEVIDIDIPKGVEDNFIITVNEWGEKDETTGIRGNLLLRIKTKYDSRFVRRGLDILYKKEITFVQSITGIDIEIPFVDKPIVINTDKFGIIDPRKEYSVSDGIENVSGVKGNIYVIFDIKYPENFNISSYKSMLLTIFSDI